MFAESQMKKQENKHNYKVIKGEREEDLIYIKKNKCPEFATGSWYFSFLTWACPFIVTILLLFTMLAFDPELAFHGI